MISNVIDDIRKDRASFARDTEYLKETAYDDMIDDRLEVAESQYIRESVEELQEAADILNQLSSEEDPMENYREITNIMESDGNITFEEMMEETDADKKNKELVYHHEVGLSCIENNMSIIRDLLRNQKIILLGIENAPDPETKNKRIKGIRVSFKNTKKTIVMVKNNIIKEKAAIIRDIAKCECPVTKKRLEKINDKYQKYLDELNKIRVEDLTY